MKKYVSIISIVILCALVIFPMVAFGSDISDAAFTGTVQATNNGATTATAVAANFTIGIPQLITAHQLNADARNIVARDDQGVDTYIMPGYAGNSTIVFYDSILPGVSRNAYIYTGNVTGGSIVAFPASAGFTVTDDSTLEWGNSGNDTFSGYFDPTSTGTLLSKGTDLTAVGNGNGTLTIAIPGTGTGGTTFPVIANSTNGSGTGTTVTATLPTGYVAGDLLLLHSSGYLESAAWTITGPAGWTPLVNTVANHSPYYPGLAVFYKIATGSEGASVTVTNSSASVKYSWSVVRIQKNTYTGIPAASATTHSASGNPDSTSLTSGFGAVDTVWFSTTMSVDTTATVPSGYTLVSKGGASTCYTYVTKKNVTSATQDPGAFSTPGNPWCAVTIAVKGFGTLASATTAAITAGWHSFTPYIYGGRLGIKVDNTSASTAYAGSITDNTNPWVFCTNGILLCVGSITASKSGAVVSTYQWEYPSPMSSILTNLSGAVTGSPKTLALGSNNCTITSSGTFTIANSFGWGVSAVSGNLTVTGSPKWCPSGQAAGSTQTTTITVSGGKGYVMLYLYRVLTDQGAGTNDAQVVLRTTSNNANVSTSLISYTPITEATVDQETVNDWPDMITAVPSQPAEMYSENVSPGIFFAPFIEAIWPDSIPISLFWYNFAFAQILLAGIGSYYLMAAKNSKDGLILKIIVMGVIMVFYSLPGPNIYGMYVDLYFIFWSFGALVLWRNFGW